MIKKDDTVEDNEISNLQKQKSAGEKSPSERLTKEEKEQKLREEKELAVLSEEELRKDREAFNLVSVAKRIEEAQERERKAQEAEKINEKRIIASQSTILNNLKKEVEQEINSNKYLKEEFKRKLDFVNNSLLDKYLATFLYYDLYKQIKHVEQKQLEKYKEKFPSYFKYGLNYEISEDDINLIISQYFEEQSQKILKFDLGIKAEHFKEKYAEQIKAKFKEDEKLEKIQYLRKKLVDLSDKEIEYFIRSLEFMRERFTQITFEINEKTGTKIIKINCDFDYKNDTTFYLKKNNEHSLFYIKRNLEAIYA